MAANTEVVSSDIQPRPWRTRGSFNPNVNALPLQNDSFIVQDPAATTSVLHMTALSRGDRVVFIGGDSTVAANWLGIPDSAYADGTLNGTMPFQNLGQPLRANQTAQSGVRVIAAKAPGFMQP
jgi:hypothetical protein